MGLGDLYSRWGFRMPNFQQPSLDLTKTNRVKPINNLITSHLFEAYLTTSSCNNRYIELNLKPFAIRQDKGVWNQLFEDLRGRGVNWNNSLWL